jgi:hypothetical protein
MDQRLRNQTVRDVIALPLQIGRGAAVLSLRVAGGAAGLGLRALGRLVGPANRAPDFDAVQEEEAPVDVAPVAPEAPPAGPPAPEAPVHVSEEPELVDSYAEPGAEDGPGASVHVAEPWKGYGHLTADDVVDRLAAASREEIAAVELYERLHRGRRTVLTAARRQLRRASAPGANR